MKTDFPLIFECHLLNNSQFLRFNQCLIIIKFVQLTFLSKNKHVFPRMKGRVTDGFLISAMVFIELKNKCITI